MSDKGTFGRRLRTAREARGLSLTRLASATNVSEQLWEGLERNDCSRWPAGVLARSFVRDYARMVGLDEQAVTNEFCSLFPLADRRVAPVLAAVARIVAHDHGEAADWSGLRPAAAPPAAVNRRSSAGLSLVRSLRRVFSPA